jgi:hypothetical protein
MSAQLNVIRNLPQISRRSSLRLVGIVAAIVVVALIGLWARYQLLGATTKSPLAAKSHPASTTGASQPVSSALTNADVLTTTLTSTGFSPRDVSHARGAFNLRVKNQSGQEEIVLRLTNANGDVIANTRLTNKVSAWTTPLELGPGLYTLTEANHNEWICQIQISE